MKKMNISGKSLAIGTFALAALLSPLTMFGITANASGVSGIEQAKAAALKDANLTASEVRFTKTVQKMDDGVQIYDIDFYHGNNEYEYEISATDYRILERDHDIRTARSNSATAQSTQKSAAASTTNTNGTTRKNNTASASATKSSGTARKNSTASASTTKSNTSTQSTTAAASGELVGVDKAKSVALADAGLDASSVVITKEKLDWENNIQVYEIEFYHNQTEYDYDIDAKTGTVYSKDIDYND